MTNLGKIAFFSLALGLVACGGADPGSASPTGGGGTTDPIVGKTCTSDAECGAGYACEAESSSPPSGGGCTPNRACTNLECRGLCLAQGEIDFETGEPNAACMSDCLANALCCDDDGSGGGGSTPAGKCVKTGGSTTPPSDGGTTAPPPASMSWSGTWNATVEYDVSCDTGFGNMKSGHHSHTLTIEIAASGTSLTAKPQAPTSSWTPMSGTGNDSGATISGEFPFRDHAGDTVGSKDNSTTLKVTAVTSANQASGAIEGRGVNRFGFKCTLANGKLSLAR